MKTLSVRQPWADLIVKGIKDIENRTWKTNFRGRVYIHAPAKIDDRGIPQCLTPQQILKIDNLDYMIKEGFLCRAIIGSVIIYDCVKNHNSIWAEPDVWNWVLKNPIRFDFPITGVNGSLSIWDYNG